MRIGLDFYGVLEECKNNQELKDLLKYISLSSEHTLFIVSGPPIYQLSNELYKAGYYYGTHYNLAISVVDFLKEVINADMWQDNKGNWWADDKVWWQSKYFICKYFSIDVLVDDLAKYGNYFEDKDNFFHYKDFKEFLCFISSITTQQKMKNKLSEVV